MAVGTVSTSTIDEPWQLISSVTASGSVTFSSISGYKRFMITWKNVTFATAQHFYLKVNNDTTAGNYAFMNTYSGADSFEGSQYIGLDATASTSHTGLIVIENVNQAMPHVISTLASRQMSGYTSAIINPVAITQIDMLSGASITGGTVAIYGIAA